jgi:hypothetical protein
MTAFFHSKASSSGLVGWLVGWGKVLSKPKHKANSTLNTVVSLEKSPSLESKAL